MRKQRFAAAGMAAAAAVITVMSGGAAHAISAPANTYACTKILPVICVGANYTQFSQNGFILNSFQVQAKVGSPVTDASYEIVFPDNDGGWTPVNRYTGGPGWLEPQFNSGTWGEAYTSDNLCAKLIASNGTILGEGCVYIP